MFRRIWDFLQEYLRINAIRRMLNIVEVKKSEIGGLVALAVVFAVFEGIGLTLLLPILQYAESGQTALTQASGAYWVTLFQLMSSLHLPVTLPVLLLMAFIPILLRQAVYYLNAWYSAVVAGRIGLRLRMRALDDVLGADLQFFDRFSVGGIVGIVVGQTASAGQAVLAVMKQLSVALLMVLYVLILLALSVPLSLISLLFAGVVSLTVRANIARIRDFGIEAATINQEMMGKIVERFGLVRLIKMRDQEEQESRKIRVFSDEMRRIGVIQSKLGANIEVTTDPLLMLSVFVTLYVGIAVFGMTLAQLGLLLFVLNRLNAKVKEFNTGRQTISQNVAGLLLVKQTTEDAKAANTIHSGPRPFVPPRQSIEFEAVSFEYPDTVSYNGSLLSARQTVLHDVSLSIPAGSFTALVGRSGSGKSTLVDLIPRLRDVTSGQVTIDGIDIREVELGSLRRSIGYLSQQAMLFNDSVLANLCYGLDRQPTEEQVRHALDAAYASFVYDLPDGLETNVGDQGSRFSGGERQRLGLARVLLADTPILILDEPTSALDSESEMYTQKALSRLHGLKTIVVIAHRLATVRQADQLVVLDAGRVVESGSHDELLQSGSAYRKLFESQLL